MSTAENPYHHGDLPTALLAAVESMILEQGHGDLSLREAARRAGVSHSAPAYHFGDKEGMLVAFCHQGFDLLYADMVAALDASADAPAAARMHALGAAYVGFAGAHRAHFEIMFRAGIDKTIHDDLGESGGRVFGLLLQTIGELQDEGHFEGEDPLEVAFYLWSVVHGFSTILVDGAMPPGLEDADFPGFLDGVLSLSIPPS